MIDYFYDGESFYTIHEGKDSFVNLDTFIKKKKTLANNFGIFRQILNTLLKLDKSIYFQEQ